MTHKQGPDSAVDAPGDARGDAPEPEHDRRSVLRGALALGTVGIGGALAGGAGAFSAAPAYAAQAPVGSAQGSTPVTGTSATRANAGVPLGPAKAVPVGGGVIYDKEKIVVTQPTAGVYKAFSAICTHQKCVLASVKGGTINCACHGGKYSITDGSAVHLPAKTPLPPKTVTVTGGNISVT